MRYIAAFASALLSACRLLLPAIKLEPAAVEPSETEASSAAAGSFSGIARMRILQANGMSSAQVLLSVIALPREYVDLSVDRHVSIGHRKTRDMGSRDMGSRSAGCQRFWGEPGTLSGFSARAGALDRGIR